MAIELTDARILYLHIPKCGGTWVRHAITDGKIRQRHLLPPGVSHQHAALEHFDLSEFRYILTFIRNPYRWYESYWKYNQVKGWPNWEPTKWHPARELRKCRHAKFSGFMYGILSRYPQGFLNSLYPTYCETRKPVPVLIGAVEHLREHLLSVLQATGVRHEREAIAKSHKRNTSPGDVTWELEHRERLEEVEKEAFALWKRAERGTLLG